MTEAMPVCRPALSSPGEDEAKGQGSKVEVIIAIIIVVVVVAAAAVVVVVVVVIVVIMTVIMGIIGIRLFVGVF